MTPSSEEIAPEVGQIWIDNDPRHQRPPRRIRLLRLVDGHWEAVVLATDRRVRIAYARLRPTSNGYRLEKPHGE